MCFFRIFVAGILFLFSSVVLPVDYRMGKVKFVIFPEEYGRKFGSGKVSFDGNMSF